MLANDFLETWSGCDLIVGTSSGVPIKRGVMEAIGTVTPVGKGKEKKIKQEAVKRAKLEESAEGTKVGPETKKRKTIKSLKQLAISEELKRVDPFTVGKEVGHPLIPKIRVKTRVEFSLFQIPMSSLAQGSSGSFDFIPQSPLGPSGCTRSRQKIIGESVERERRARLLSFFFFPLSLSFN